MKQLKAFAAATAALLFTAVPTFAANWFNLKEFGPVTQRVAVTLENPADVDDSAATAHIPLDELSKTLPDARPGQICVVDPQAKPAHREEADKNFVPSQISDGKLIFSVPLKAHEKKALYIYTAPQPLNMPGFPAKTSFDSRHAYRSFENNYAAFRMETGPGANTTGLAIDLFGKTKKGEGARLEEIYSTIYHHLNPWGVDILKVGSGPGDGGIYLYVGDQVGRASFETTFVHCEYQGPVETKLKVTAPIEVAGKTYHVVRYLTLIGEDRSIHDRFTVEGDDLDHLQIGLAVRDLPNCEWVEHPDKGYCFQTGDANQPNYKAVGLGVTFDPSEYVKTIELPDKDNGGHVYVLKGKREGDLLVSEHRIGDIWDMDGQLPHPVEKPQQLRKPFESWLSAWAAQRDKPVLIEIGKEAQKQ